MNDNSTILLLDSIIDAEDIKALKTRGWLGSELSDVATYPDKESHKSTLGLNIKKIGKELRHAVLITNLEFEDSAAFYLDNNNDFFAMSSSRWDQSAPAINPKLLILLYILKWVIQKQISCTNPGCYSSVTFESAHSAELCAGCQRNLCAQDKGDLVAVALALRELFKRPADSTDRFLQQGVGHPISHYKITSSIPIVSIALADCLINYYAPTDSQTRTWLLSASTDIYSNKQAIIDKYIALPSRRPSLPTMIAARRWSSWTPARPNSLSSVSSDAVIKSEILGHRTGGGYFVSDGNTTIAIDPGYGYLELLYDEYGLTVCDIDAVMITHDHPDHSSALSNILAIRFVYKDKCAPLFVYLNPSSTYLYERLLQYYSAIISPTGPVKMEPNSEYYVGQLNISTIGMFHDEIFDSCRDDIKALVGTSKALGLVIKGRSSFISKDTFTFVITGDTSFPTDSRLLDSLNEFYGQPDIAAIHLGSIEKQWSQNPLIRSHMVDYGQGKHLGINGCAKMIALLRPRTAVITEIGEELDLKHYRRTVSDIIKKFSINISSTVLPSDVGLMMVMKEDKILCRCMSCGRYVPIEVVQVADKDGYLYYSYDSGCGSHLDHYDL